MEKTDAHITQTPTTGHAKFKCGYVALIGRPNVGKSTLMNNLLQIKLSIVTPKPQTTRHRILGILNEPDYQIIFLDTPGFLEPKYKLQEIMAKTIRRTINDADLILFMIESDEKPSPKDISILNELTTTDKPIILIINKIDLIDKDKLLPLIDSYSSQFKLIDIIPVSALTMDGFDILRNAIKTYLPYSVPFYPPDVLTEHPERFFVAEIIREKIFQKYGEEIPYSTTVTIEEFKEREHGKDYIRATIYVERTSQKGILIGKKGAALKTVGQLARKDIELFLQRQVFLDLHVSIKEKWRFKEGTLRELGYGP